MAIEVDERIFQAPLEMRKPSAPCGDSDIQEFERSKKVKLPDVFRKFLLERNGGYPEPDCFTTANRKRYAIKEFFPLAQLHDSYLPMLIDFGRGPCGDLYAIRLLREHGVPDAPPLTPYK